MNRLKQLREERGITQAALGRFLNVRDAAISKYESESVPMTAETIVKLADYFSVSADYLLGRSQTSNVISEISCEEVTYRIRKLISEAKKDTSDMVASLNSGILSGKCSDMDAFMKDVYLIADFFGVTDEYILGGSSAEEMTDYSLSSEEKKFLAIFQDLDDINKDIIIGDMRRYIKEQSNESSVAADDQRKVVGK